MNILNELKECLPIITALLGAFLAYFFNNRKSRSEQFRKDAVEGLEEFYSPLFHEMHTIKVRSNLGDYKDVEELNKLVDKLVSKDTKIYKSYNQNLVNMVYELDKKLKTYDIKKEDEILKDAFNLFDQLYNLVDKEYWGIQKSLYKQYPWYKQLNKRNYIIRFLMDLSTLIYETVQFLVFLWGFIAYAIFIDNITGSEVSINAFRDNFRDITVILVGLFAIALTIRIPYFIITSDYRRKSRIQEKIEDWIWAGIKNISLSISRNFLKLIRSVIAYLNKLLKKVKSKFIHADKTRENNKKAIHD